MKKRLMAIVLAMVLILSITSTALATASTIDIGGTVTGGSWRSQGSQPSYHNYNCTADIETVSFSTPSTSLKFGIYVGSVCKSNTPRITSPYPLEFNYSEKLSGVTLTLKAYSGSSSSGSATYDGTWTN